MTVLNFLSRLQLENYVMIAFSIQPIRTYGQQTIFPHLRVAVANFQYRWEWQRANCLLLFYWYQFLLNTFLEEINKLLTEFDLKEVTSVRNIFPRKWWETDVDSLVLWGSLSSTLLHPFPVILHA